MMQLGFLLLGMVTGCFSGILGIGGGIIMIPVLMSLFGFDQKLAQGTSLASMIPPVGLFAAYVYHKNGHIHILGAMLIALGFFAGSYGGALVANALNQDMLRKIFGGMLLVVGSKFLFF